LSSTLRPNRTADRNARILNRLASLMEASEKRPTSWTESTASAKTLRPYELSTWLKSHASVFQCDGAWWSSYTSNRTPELRKHILSQRTNLLARPDSPRTVNVQIFTRATLCGIIAAGLELPSVRNRAMSTCARAKSINLLLYDGTLRGVVGIEDSAWRGEMYSAPRDSMEELLSSGACDKYGVYLLLAHNRV
jgi:hypothetical protein